MLKAAGVYSNPGWYCGQKNLRLLATQVAREKAALGPGWQMIPTLTTMGATAFAGGRLRSDEMFDIWAQSFANGATGVAIFEDPYTDDPGTYLAMAEAISIAAKHEDIIFDGTASSAVTVHSGNAVGSAIKKGSRHFIAISPDAIDAYAGTDTPPASTVDVSFAAEGAAMLSDLRDAGKPPTKCAGTCRMQLQLDSTAVFLLAPAAAGAGQVEA